MVQFKKTLIAILILTASVASAQAQKNVYKSVGVSYTVGAPNWTPTAKQNTEIARDSVTGTWYIWSLDSATWHATQFIEFVDAAPTYTPGKGQPLVAIDSSGIIYRYRAGAWSAVSGGGGGGLTNGDKIDIDVYADGDSLIIDTAAVTDIKVNDVNISKITSGDLQAGFAATLPNTNTTARVNYDNDNSALLIDDLNNGTSISGEDGTNYVYVDNGAVTLGSGATKAEFINGVLKLYDSDSTQSVSITVPHTDSLTTSWTFTFPSTDGSPNQVLTTNGSGITSWTTVSGVGGGTDTSGYNLTLRISGDTLYLADGDGELNVPLSAYLDNTDAQTLSVDSTTVGSNKLFEVAVSGGNSVFITVPQPDGTGTDTSGYNQVLSISGDTLYLTDGDGTLSQDLSAYLDNTDAQTLSVDSTTVGSNKLFEVAVSGGNSVFITVPQPDGTGTDTSGYNQVLSISGDTLYITDGDGTLNADLSAYLDNTDDQKIDTFSISSTTISLSLESDGESAKTISLASLPVSLSQLTQSGATAGQVPQWNGASWVAATVTAGGDADSDPSNELQVVDTFSIVSDSLRISLSSDGEAYHAVDLSAYLDNTDTSGYNQALSISGDTLYITDGDGTLNADLSAYLDNTDAQTLSVDSTTVGSNELFEVSVSGGNSVFITVPQPDGTGTDTSGYNQALSISGDTLYLTDGDGTLNADLSAYLDNTDAQTLSVDSTTVGSNELFEVSVSGGNSVFITVPQPDGTGTDTSGYNQALTLSNDTLYITDGNSTLNAKLTGLGDGNGIYSGSGTIDVSGGNVVANISANDGAFEMRYSNNIAGLVVQNDVTSAGANAYSYFGSYDGAYYAGVNNTNAYLGASNDVGVYVDVDGIKLFDGNGTLGNNGQVLTSDGTYATWQNTSNIYNTSSTVSQNERLVRIMPDSSFAIGYTNANGFRDSYDNSRPFRGMFMDYGTSGPDGGIGFVIYDTLFSVYNGLDVYDTEIDLGIFSHGESSSIRIDTTYGIRFNGQTESPITTWAYSFPRTEPSSTPGDTSVMVWNGRYNPMFINLSSIGGGGVQTLSIDSTITGSKEIFGIAISGGNTIHFDVPQINGIGVTDGDKGDIDVTSSGTVWTVDTAAITAVKLNQMSAATGEYLRWNGTTWDPDSAKVVTDSYPIGGTGTASDPITFLPIGSTGQVFKWNGAFWAAGTDNDGIYTASGTSTATVTASGGTFTIKDSDNNNFFTVNDGTPGSIDIYSQDPVSGGFTELNFADGDMTLYIDTTTTAKILDYRGNAVGIEYYADYSNALKANARSIPDVGTVRKIVSDSIAVAADGNGIYDGNGTIPASTTATLAGTLSFDNAASYTLNIGDVGNADAGVGIKVDNTYARMGNVHGSDNSYVISGAGGNYVRTNSSNLQQTTTATSWNLLSGDFKFVDDRATKKGIEYSADYSAAILANARSIPDVGIVQGLISDSLGSVAADGNGIYSGSGTIDISGGSVYASLSNNIGSFGITYGSGNSAIQIDNDSGTPAFNQTYIYSNDGNTYSLVKDGYIGMVSSGAGEFNLSGGVTTTLAAADVYYQVRYSTGAGGLYVYNDNTGSQIGSYASINSQNALYSLFVGEEYASFKNNTVGSGFYIDAGGILINDSSATAGTSGQVLTSDGTHASWQDATGDGNGIYDGDGATPSGGTTVDVTGNDPLIFSVNSGTGQDNRMVRMTTDYSSDDAYTRFLQMVAPTDSLTVTSFDQGISLSYAGPTGTGTGLSIISNTTLALDADSVYLTTIPAKASLPNLIGTTGAGVVSKLLGVNEGDVVTWDSVAGNWVPSAAPGGVTDHGALSGLSDDDHAQYALLAGRATGQVLTGGTASGDDLTLRSTSNATKGSVIIGDTGGDVLINGAASLGSPYSLVVSGAISTTAGRVDIRGSGVPASSSTAAGLHIYNTTGLETLDIGVEDDDEVYIGTGNVGQVAKINTDGVVDFNYGIRNRQITESPTFSTNNYTMVLADEGKLLQLSNGATAGTLTVPPNASVAFPVGTHIDLIQTGSGQITVTPGSGVTINSADSKTKFRVQYSGATLVKIATNTWLLFGDISL